MNLDMMKIHHIGIACKNISATIEKKYKNCEYSQEFYDENQGVKIVFVTTIDNQKIELIESIIDNSPVSKMLKERDEVVYHSCYTIDNINNAMSSLKNQNFIQVSDIINAPALENKKIFFLYNASVGLIELLEI